MNRLLVKLTITAAAGGLLFSNPTVAQILPRLNRKHPETTFRVRMVDLKAADDLLLQGELDGGRWRERWVGEPSQQVHHTGGRRTNPSVPSAKVTATGRAPPWITLTSTPAHRPILRSGTLVDWGRARRRTGHHSVGR
jgi:DNA-binding transcriptional LysR family regulator